MKIDIKTVSDLKKMEQEHSEDGDFLLNTETQKKQKISAPETDALDDIMREFEAAITDFSDNTEKKSEFGVDWDEDA